MTTPNINLTQLRERATERLNIEKECDLGLDENNEPTAEPCDECRTQQEIAEAMLALIDTAEAAQAIDLAYIADARMVPTPDVAAILLLRETLHAYTTQ